MIIKCGIVLGSEFWAVLIGLSKWGRFGNNSQSKCRIFFFLNTYPGCFTFQNSGDNVGDNDGDKFGDSFGDSFGHRDAGSKVSSAMVTVLVRDGDKNFFVGNGGTSIFCWHDKLW